MIELTPVRLMRVVKKTKARVHTSLINLTMVIRYTVILADKHTMQNKKKFLLEVKKEKEKKNEYNYTIYNVLKYCTRHIHLTDFQL